MVLSQEEITDLLKINGEIRGAAFQTDAVYIRKTQGPEGLQKIEESLKDFGFAVKYDRIRAMEWLPLKARVACLLTMRNLFNWSDDGFVAMGDAGPKASFIIRLLTKFLASPQTVFNSAPKYWVKYYTIGRLESIIMDEEKRIAILHLKDFQAHPLYCRYLEGFFRRLVQYNFPDAVVSAQETACVFRGDQYHKFKFNW